MKSRVETLSAKGVLVDFDLLKLKQQIGTNPKPLVVEARENFIDNKFKRKINRQLNSVIESLDESVEEPSIEEPLMEKPTKKDIKHEHKSDS
jgi:hypothetical protein